MTPLGTLDSGEAVTPADGTDLPQGFTRALYIGVTGDVVATVGATNLTFKAVPVGLLWIRATRVLATGTTATNILALR